MTPSTDTCIATHPDPQRVAFAIAAVDGMPTDVLAKLPLGALAAARTVCASLVRFRELVGFNDDTEVDGGDAVDALGRLWETVQLAASVTAPADPGRSAESVGLRMAQRTEGWRSMEQAPRDGRILRLLVRFEEHATEDASEAWTIGSNSYENTGQDEWNIAGWCWEHDHFTAGKGTPIGWLPMLSSAVLALDEKLEKALVHSAIADIDHAFGSPEDRVATLAGAGLTEHAVAALAIKAGAEIDGGDRPDASTGYPGYGAMITFDQKQLVTFARDVAMAGTSASGTEASVAAIEFALAAEDGLAFLRNWNQGEFDVCRREWPEAPADCYVGADPALVAVDVSADAGALDG